MSRSAELAIAGNDVAAQGVGPAETSTKTEPFQIPSLDGIRAVSFFTVFLAHAGLGAWVPGYFGLTLFFFLSGYLITTLLRMEYDKTSDVSLRQFYLRRVLRIFPPFYLVLTVAAGLTALGLLGGQLTTGGLLAQVFHLTNYFIIRHGWWEGLAPGTWVYWSLAVEEHFYLVFPIVFLFLRRRMRPGREMMWALLGLCALVFAWRCLLVFGLHAPKDRTYVASDTRVDSILFGCILAVWQNPVLDREQVSDRVLAWFWLPIGLSLLALSFVIRQNWFDQTFRYTLQGAGLLPVFIAAIRWHDRGAFRLLSWKPLRTVGVLSYSLYLMHTVALWAVEQWTPWPVPVRSTVALIAVLLLAQAIYVYIERPIGRVRKRLVRYLSPPRVAAG